MYAVIKTGGKQYRVAPNDVLTVEKLAGEAGDTVEFTEVLLVADDNGANVGTPLVAGACVAGEVVGQGRARKIIIFKKKRRKNYRRRNGHRQMLTTVRITEILTDGRKPAKAARAAKADKAETAPADAEGGEAPAKAAKAAAPKKAAARPAAKKTAAKKTGDKPSDDA